MSAIPANAIDSGVSVAVLAPLRYLMRRVVAQISSNADARAPASLLAMKSTVKTVGDDFRDAANGSSDYRGCRRRAPRGLHADGSPRRSRARFVGGVQPSQHGCPRHRLDETHTLL